MIWQPSKQDLKHTIELNMKAVLSALVIALAALSLASCASKSAPASAPVDMGLKSSK